jgi:hypothetical protein
MLGMFAASSSSPPVTKTSATSCTSPTKDLLAKSNLTAMTPMMASMASKVKAGKKGKKAMREYGIVFDTNGVHRPMPKLMPERKVYRALMSTSYPAFTSSITVPIYNANYVTLNSFTNTAEYVGLFDQYRFVEIEMWIEPETSSSTTIAPIWWSAVDYDDATIPSSIQSVAGKQSATASSSDAGHYHRFRPHVAVAEYSGSFTSYGNVPSTWADCGSPNIQNFGVKTAVNIDGVARTFQVVVRAIVEFKEAGI